MKLHRLALTAFGPFGTTQDIDFDALTTDGLFLLHGPTGAGKTSVLDAVCFALYGTVPGARQSPGTPLRSDHAAADTFTEVLLELTLGGRRLEITRFPAQQRRKKRGTGFTPERARSLLREYDAPGGTWRALSLSHQEIGEELEQLIGMSREQFCQVVLLPQGDFARFLRADAEARSRLLGRLFDTRCFAAVEERLAERRRTTEARVRTGDERLLALAHRMAQAAAGATGDWPPPDGRPGDPGLADAVLAGAAVARSGARERLDAARGAVALAEDRRNEARAALDTAREHDRLRRRYEETRRRRAASEAARPAHEEVLARLEEARRAERVAPALTLRAAAERDHRTAAAALAAARAALPAGLAEADPDRLAGTERDLRREAGALAAARRAEDRGAGIARERAALDRAARADEDARQDAGEWLAGWDALRRRHQDRLAAAQEAATRAEQLAGRLGPARLRRDAARERDRLATEATGAEDALRTAREDALTARTAWLDLKERRLAQIAAELAAGLVPGEPCAVCGSADHPAPARPGTDRVAPADEDAAYETHTRAEEDRSGAERRLDRIRTALAAARLRARDDEPADAPGAGPDSRDPSAAELAALVAGVERDLGEARALASGIHAAREALDRAEREHEERLRDRHRVDQRVAARTAEREALDRELAALTEELDRARGGARSVAERAAELERLARLAAGAAEAVRAAAEAARRLKEADGRTADAAYRAGFPTPEAAAAAVADDTEHRGLQRAADLWRAEAAAVADRLAEPGTRAAAALPPADPAAAAATLETADRALRNASAALASARDRAAELDALSAEAAAAVRGSVPLRAEHARVARLAALTAGTSAQNEHRMRLESYVLAARLEQVAAAATGRLLRMSAGRYSLTHSDARSGGGRSGLGLRVLDAWTGRERDTATLSGGETFFASLALALGLADVVTEEAGGVRLDTLFIDEGFGSLDEQTLDEVLDVLDSLRERDRSVGIVSHVADLRRRVPIQLEVVKERHGSTVRLRTGAPDA
ncbi:SMC family ATPase [Streptomyces sp. NPDC006798]|uniref:SMC family ATPase n=1 Tax=Streptomyces sp. NPDC006798 TaxID=3155462 RepID=UPI0033F3EDA4